MVFTRRLFSFSHGSSRRHKAQSSSPAPKTQPQIDGRPPKGPGRRRDGPSGRKGRSKSVQKVL